VRRAPEDVLPTIARPPPRGEMVEAFLQRGALKDGPPCSGPVALADGGLLPQEKLPDAGFQGGDVGRLTHAQSPDGAVGFAGLTCCACDLCLPRCSSGGHCGREGREGRNPFSPPPSATRRRCRARGQPLRSCRWCACSLPCQYGKGCRFVRVPEKIRKTIPVLTPMAHYANRMSRYIRLRPSRNSFSR
jgi:hypothetical protein